MVFRNPDVPLTAEQAELRRLVLKQIETHPDTFWMGEWEYSDSICGTTRCIDGWAQYLTHGKIEVIRDSNEVEVTGVRLLGLTEEEYYGGRPRGSVVSGLFYLSDKRALQEMRRLAGE